MESEGLKEGSPGTLFPPEFRVAGYEIPGVWENYISNDEYCLVVTATGRGLSFFRYLPYFQVTTGGRSVYLRDLSRERVWGVSQEPPHDHSRALYEDLSPLVLTQDAQRAAGDPPFPLPAAGKGFDEYECVHGAGYTILRSVFEDVRAVLELTVPPADPVELWRVEVENLGDEERVLAVMPTVGLVMGGGTAMVGNYPTYNSIEWDPRKAVLSATNRGIRFYGLPNLHVSLAASETPEGMSTTVSGSYEAITTGKTPSDLAHGEPIQVLLFHRLTLAPKEKKSISFALSAGSDQRRTRDCALKWARPGAVKRARESLNLWWSDLRSRFQVEIPDKEMEEFVNGWLQVELVQCARWVRGGGDRGYRDILQDAWALSALRPERARQLIQETLTYQYSSGRAPRSYPPVAGCPVGTRKSADSALWIPLALGGYLRETGDFSLLEEKVGFRDVEEESPVIDHAFRAVSLVFGERGSHDLPLFREGDWNDGLDGAGRGGQGESVWLGMFFVAAAVELARLLMISGSEQRADEVVGMAREVRRAVDEHGWDGEYYRRGYNDRGDLIGSSSCEEGKIYLLPQAWATLGVFGDEGRRRQALEAADRFLDTPIGPKLLHPAYTVRDPSLGRITARVPGTSDNAGVQTHAGVMKAAADFAAGRGERGYETLRALSPLNPVRRQTSTATPPFVLNSQTIGPDNPRFGAREIAWLTGAAGWFFRTMGQACLGVRPEFDGLRIDPCVPPTWKEFRVTRLFRDTRYRIRVMNPQGGSRGVKVVRVDGQEIEGNLVSPGIPGETSEVEVTMG